MKEYTLLVTLLIDSEKTKIIQFLLEQGFSIRGGVKGDPVSYPQEACSTLFLSVKSINNIDEINLNDQIQKFCIEENIKYFNIAVIIGSMAINPHSNIKFEKVASKKTIQSTARKLPNLNGLHLVKNDPEPEEVIK